MLFVGMKVKIRFLMYENPKKVMKKITFLVRVK